MKIIFLFFKGDEQLFAFDMGMLQIFKELSLH
jgi:hypothetical protein